MTYSIVVPCYNEEKNLILIAEKFADIILDNMEVIMVDNGSTDQSSQVLSSLSKKYDFIKIVHVPVNQGYGYGILQGLKEAEGHYIGWTHADLQTDPKDVITAFNIIDNHSEENVFVKGNRKGRPLFDTVFTVGMGIFESLYLGKRMSDINAQPNIFPREFFEQWKEPPYDFSLDLYAVYMAQAWNMKVIKFPVLFPPRIHGSSHWNDGWKSKFKFIKRTLTFSTELKKRGIL